jgi:hypothetical protein
LSLINKVKTSLRVTHNSLNGEIQDLIDAAKSDLELSGVEVIDETDSLIIRAVTVYCKANFGWDNPDMLKFQQSYDSLKNHLTMSEDYKAGDD